MPTGGRKSYNSSIGITSRVSQRTSPMSSVTNDDVFPKKDLDFSYSSSQSRWVSLSRVIFTISNVA